MNIFPIDFDSFKSALQDISDFYVTEIELCY